MVLGLPQPGCRREKSEKKFSPQNLSYPRARSRSHDSSSQRGKQRDGSLSTSSCDLKGTVLSAPTLAKFLKGNLLPTDCSRRDGREKLKSCRKSATKIGSLFCQAGLGHPRPLLWHVRGTAGHVASSRGTGPGHLCPLFWVLHQAVFLLTCVRLRLAKRSSGV